MKTMMQDQWKQYRDAVYPKGISAVQNKECHQAFFAGALVAVQSALAASRNGGIPALEKVCQDIITGSAGIAVTALNPGGKQN